MKSGECPNTEGMIGICVEQCTADDSCEGEQKCCSNGCGHTCMAPVPVGECQLKIFLRMLVYFILYYIFCFPVNKISSLYLSN